MDVLLDILSDYALRPGIFILRLIGYPDDDRWVTGLYEILISLLVWGGLISIIILIYRAF